MPARVAYVTQQYGLFVRPSVCDTRDLSKRLNGSSYKTKDIVGISLHRLVTGKDNFREPLPQTTDEEIRQWL